MALAVLKQDLEQQRSKLEQADHPLDPSQMIALIDQWVDQLNAPEENPFARLVELSDYIKDAREEIAEIRPQDIAEEHVPQATDELDAIVEATEGATNSIFEAVESIEALTDKMDEALADEVVGHVTAVYEACSFQDITGQRITKVIGALKHIEEKVDALIEVIDIEKGGDALARRKEEREAKKVSSVVRPDEDLLNGPQDTASAISQDDVDALMGFD